MRLTTAIAACLLLPGTLGAQTKTAAADPANAEWAITLDGAAGGRALVLRLSLVGGRMRAAFATGFNSRWHEVDASGLALEGGRLHGQVKATITPDPWAPADGKPVAASYSVDANAQDGAVVGTYKGVFGGKECDGKASGTTAARLAPDSYTRFRIRFFAPLLRLRLKGGVNASYALDMNLIFSVKDGKVQTPQFETIVPDYRFYSAVVKSHDLKIDGVSFGGPMQFVIDGELHEYVVRGQIIGDAVAGTYDTKVGELSAKGDRFLGSYTLAAPPPVGQCIAWMRMHDAMNGGKPVLLNLSLSDAGTIHGYAFAPGYNHQPHAVDASALKLVGSNVKGDVSIKLGADCYKPSEDITLRYSIDAAVDGADVNGSYTGIDRGQKLTGAITGEVRPRALPAVKGDLSNLKRCELGLGYSLVSSTLPHAKGAEGNHMNVSLVYKDAKISSAEFVNPKGDTAYDAQMDEAQVKIDGNRMTGSVAFTLKNAQVSVGQYRYTFEAIIDGDKFSGFWRGMHKDKEILTKSSKLQGRLVLDP